MFAYRVSMILFRKERGGREEEGRKEGRKERRKEGREGQEEQTHCEPGMARQASAWH